MTNLTATSRTVAGNTLENIQNISKYKTNWKYYKATFTTLQKPEVGLHKLALDCVLMLTCKR